jgi:molecular chaperone GrpE
MADNNEDIVFDDSAENLDDSVVAEEHQSEAIKKLKERLKEAESKAKEHLDGWQRAQADFMNLRKRDEEAKQEFLKFAKSDVVSELLPVLDSMNLALSHGEKGVEPIHKQFIQILKKHGLEEMNPLGEPFDPKLHEAIGVVATDEPSEDNKILEVMQKGYILSGKTLRPAIVRTGEYKVGRN